ncbi:MAG: hypothetical protein HY899_05170 [Deltaproteobacteria bacterium]|nr:hypothetical protein [Deltaproteobacteria bacterium]
MSFSISGIRAEQGPPLSIPMSFFLTAPLALCAAGALLLGRGGDEMGSVWGPTNVAVVHLGVVGFLMLVMVGALYQMLPVVAGAVVPMVRLAHAVHALLVTGCAALVTAQATGNAATFTSAIVLITAALALFVIPAGAAVVRTRVTGPTAWGMRLSLLALTIVVSGGLWMASARAGAAFHGEWLTLRWAHAHVGFLGWIGALIAAVSWQVVPMFFLTPAAPKALPWAVLAGVAISLLALTGVTLAKLPSSQVAWACAPAALAVWIVQPAWALWALRGRKRKRKDPSLWFWWLSIGSALLCPCLGAAALLRPEPALPLLYGLCVLWGFGAALVHGMLTRIVPFLVWLHHCAPRVGTAPVPSTRELLPDVRTARGFWLHLGTALAGVVAALLAQDIAWRVFGAGLLLTGAHLEMALWQALRAGKAPASR